MAAACTVVSSRPTQLVVMYVGQCLCKEKAATSKVCRGTREYYTFHCSGVIMRVSLMYGLCLRVHCITPSHLFLGAEPQGRAGYPPVAPKPSAVSMATGGAAPQEGSPAVMKKMLPVQSSRPQPAASVAMAQQGERQRASRTDQILQPSVWCSQSHVIHCGCRSRWGCLLLRCSSSRAESASRTEGGQEAARPTAASPSRGGGGGQRL